MYFPCFCILEMKYMTLLQRDRENIELGFVTITVGLMLRSDKLGVTSVIRDLALSPDCYDSMIHFFRYPHGTDRCTS